MDTDLTDNAFIDAIRETIPKPAPKKPRKRKVSKALSAVVKRTKPKAKRKLAKKTVKAKRTKPKAKRKPAKKVKHPKAKRLKVTAKTKRKVTVPERSERLDMRLTKTEKAKVNAKAKKLRRTVTSIVIEAIEKIK